MALDAVRDAVRAWVVEHVPVDWRDAAARGGAAAIREVRSRRAYEEWYPVFGASGLVVPTWPVAYGGLDLPSPAARAIDGELRPYNLGRLNPLGLNLCAHGLERLLVAAARAGQLDDVIAEIGLDQVADLALLHGVDGRVEFLDHGATAEEVEVTAVDGRTLVLRVLLGQFGE